MMFTPWFKLIWLLFFPVMLYSIEMYFFDFSNMFFLIYWFTPLAISEIKFNR